MKHDYEKIVHEALTEPGKIASAYSAFWNFSMGNQMLALWQIGKPEPISTFNGWKTLGRHVLKGSKAIELIMPVIVKAKDVEPDQDGRKIIFLPKRHWFSLSQTDGDPYVPVVPQFDLAKAEAELKITVEPFQHMDGNVQGYAKTDQRIIAISPVAYDGFRTAAHEIAHVLLHPGIISLHAADCIPKDVREVEAEMTSYLVSSALDHTDKLTYSRGYIQHYVNDGTLEKVRFGKVFGAVDAILKAGRIEPDRPRGPPDSQPEAGPPA